MSRPTTVRHPLATLRQALELGRTQLGARIGLSRPALEKVERGRNPFTPALRERVFAKTGVCPGWLAEGKGPVHTADGHPVTPAELARWEGWRRLTTPSGQPLLRCGGSDRPLGPLHREGCCPGPERLLAYSPMEVLPGTEPQVHATQSMLCHENHRRLCRGMIERVHGALAWCLANWEQREAEFWDLVATMDRLFAGVPPRSEDPDPASLFAPPQSSIQSTPPKTSKSQLKPASSSARNPRRSQRVSGTNARRLV